MQDQASTLVRHLHRPCIAQEIAVLWWSLNRLYWLYTSTNEHEHKVFAPLVRSIQAKTAPTRQVWIATTGLAVSCNT
jgi:hypothetical protein